MQAIRSLGLCFRSQPPMLPQSGQMAFLLVCSFRFRGWDISSGLPSAFVLRRDGSFYFVAVAIAFDAPLFHAFAAQPLVFLPLVAARPKTLNKTVDSNRYERPSPACFSIIHCAHIGASRWTFWPRFAARLFCHRAKVSTPTSSSSGNRRVM